MDETNTKTNDTQSQALRQRLKGDIKDIETDSKTKNKHKEEKLTNQAKIVEMSLNESQFLTIRDRPLDVETESLADLCPPLRNSGSTLGEKSFWNLSLFVILNLPC